MEANYVPGRRNIGLTEVRRRWRFGAIGVGASLLILLALAWMDAPRLARLILAVPLLITFLGWVQASSET